MQIMKNSKLKKLKINKVKLPKKINIPLKKQKVTLEKVNDAIKSAPNITNETISKHREDILGTARKFIYPLQHSKHRFVRLSVAIFSVVVLGFFVYCGVELYVMQSTDVFIYRVTEVIPFPVAKEGGRWISYYSYLFELRRNMHYYITQQQANFSTKDGKNQLNSLKKQSMQRVIQDAYISDLANKNNVSVNSLDIDKSINLVKQQNKLGSSDQVLNNVLSEYWGWNQRDFRTELGLELLSQKVVAKLDVDAYSKANNAIEQLNSGKSFGDVASQFSDDKSTSSNGGQYPNSITMNDSSISPVVINELFNMSLGKTSGIVNTGTALEILNLLGKSGGAVQAAHIQINLKSISSLTDSLQSSNKPSVFIGVPYK